MSMLQTKGCPLGTYDEVMAWHFKSMPDIKELASYQMKSYNTLKDCRHYISRHDLFTKLYKRYVINARYKDKKRTQPVYYNVKTTTLPVSQAKVNLIYYKAQDIVLELLTDPRFSDEDWLHHDPENPLAPPPEGGHDTIKDVNTGECYAEATKSTSPIPASRC